MGCGAAEATGLGFVCFVVINPRVLSNRVDLGFFATYIFQFSNFTPTNIPHSYSSQSPRSISSRSLVRDTKSWRWGVGGTVFISHSFSLFLSSLSLSFFRFLFLCLSISLRSLSQPLNQVILPPNQAQLEDAHNATQALKNDLEDLKKENANLLPYKDRVEGCMQALGRGIWGCIVCLCVCGVYYRAPIPVISRAPHQH